ncbi:MAG: acyl carrier protein [Clostridia bacterium]|nr:acyl carrier protein [Clostridia bacterium]
MFETLKNLLVEELQLDADEITMESNLANDLGVNSIELADLIFMCEDKFGIEIKDEDLYNFVTIGDVVNYLEKNVQQ